MDLKDLTPKSDVVVVELKHPVTQEPLLNEDDSPMTVSLYAPHTKEYKTVLWAVTDERLKAAAKTGKIEVKAEDLEVQSIESLAKTTKEWSITFDSEKPTLSYDKAKQIYTEVFWIKDQLEAALSSYLDFLKG
jgi:hypothetical protein